VTWIANGLLQHKENLTVTLVDQNIDVRITSETHFTIKSYIKIQSFGVYLTVHPNSCVKGGSVVIIKEEISHHEITKIGKEEFQVTSVKIKTTSGITTVAATYSPPRHGGLPKSSTELLWQVHPRKRFQTQRTHIGGTVKCTLPENQHIGRQIEIRCQI